MFAFRTKRKVESSKKSKTPNEDTVTFFLSGDVMTGRGVDQALPHSVDAELYERYVNDARDYLRLAEKHSGKIPKNLSYDYIWGDALRVLEHFNPFARIINLETTITTSDDYCTDKNIHYRMHPQNTKVLTEAGIDVAVLANNHILDWGRTGLHETLQTLHKHNLQTSGAGNNAKEASRPSIINLPRSRLLVFGYATVNSGILPKWKAKKGRAGVNLLENLTDSNAKKVIKNINTYRREDDIVILSIHWGGNWGYRIPKSQRRFAHTLIESGTIDLLHGHSSHHPKGIEVYQDRLILYGCGDLINDYEGIDGYEEFRDDLSLLYFPTLNLSGELFTLQMVPMKISQFRLNTPDKSNTEWLFERLNRECKKLNTELEADKKMFKLYW